MHLDGIWTSQLERVQTSGDDLHATASIGHDMLAQIENLLRESDFIQEIWPHAVQEVWPNVPLDALPEMEGVDKQDLPWLMPKAASYVIGGARQEKVDLTRKINNAMRAAQKGGEAVEGDLSKKWKAALMVLCGGMLVTGAALCLIGLPLTVALVAITAPMNLIGGSMVAAGVPVFLE